MSAVVAGDIVLAYSVKTGSAGATTASSAANSLGTYISTTAWAGGTPQDLFPNISGAANAAGQTDYVAIFCRNNNASNDMTNTTVYISAEVSGGASIALAADPTAASAVGSASAQALTATTSTAPGSGVTSLTYSSPTTAAGGVSLGTISPGQCRAFWIRRSISNAAALSSDGVTIAISADTGSL